MPRSLSVAVLVFSLVLNGCASLPHSTQPEAPAEQRVVWDRPPEKPKGRFLTWCKEHPWKAGFAAAGLVAGSIAVLFVGASAYSLAHTHGSFGPN